jgi:molecular chaperone IbpA
MIKRINYPSIVGRGTFDQFFDEVFSDPFAVVRRSTEGYPLTDLYKDGEDNQVIEVALAGFSREELNIEVKDNSIVISCESPLNNGTENQRRIARRSFTRSFVDYDHQLDMRKSNASFANGLLRIVIPATEEAKPTVIDIQ